jgi:AraC-like DNA-binding protein/ligand-binding sensor protein
MKNLAHIEKQYNTSPSFKSNIKHRPGLFCMKNENAPELNTPRNKTHPILLKAYRMMLAYSQATGSMICVHDHNHLPIPEMIDDIVFEKNICLYCAKYRGGICNSNQPDLTVTPCDELHINAIKEANRFGGSHIYMCELGFMFWTSPIYSEGRFIGSLLGAGYLSTENYDTSARVYKMCNGEIPEEEVQRCIAAFPRGAPEKIKALAEILLICAESLSTGSEDYHEILRRRAEQQSILSEKIDSLRALYPNGAIPGYPIDKERILITALRRGDNETAAEILNDLLAVLLFANPNHFRYIQFRAIELVVLLSRADINPGHSGNAALETNNYYLRQIQESKTIEELTDTLHSIVQRIAGQIFSFQGIRHAAALRKAERFILENFTRKISLQEIADNSGLSAPYFSTIFKEEMGENLSKYLNRLRVEKAGRMLVETNLSLSEIAGSCGFEDQSWFSKIFKTYTGMSPGKYRSQGGGMVKEISEDNISEDYLKIIR